MLKIEKYSEEYKEELYKFVFNIMIDDVKKTPEELKKELVDLEDIKQYYKDNFWIALSKRKIIGSIGLKIEENKAQIKRVYVAKEHRHEGIGTLLYKELENAAIKNNVYNLYLNAGTNLLNAHKFYEKLGYSNCGISENGNSYVYKKRIEKYL